MEGRMQSPYMDLRRASYEIKVSRDQRDDLWVSLSSILYPISPLPYRT